MKIAAIIAIIVGLFVGIYLDSFYLGIESAGLVMIAWAAQQIPRPRRPRRTYYDPNLDEFFYDRRKHG